MSTKMNMIVNEEVYTNLVLAKRNIEFLLKRGKVSAQMESMGTKLSSDDKEYIIAIGNNNADLEIYDFSLDWIKKNYMNNIDNK